MSNNIKSYNFTRELCQDLLDHVSDEFWRKNQRFKDFVDSMLDETKDLRIHDLQTHGKRSQGHLKVIELFRELFPAHRIEENCTIDFVVEGKKRVVEFDVVNFSINMIIEIDGEHHRTFTPHFHKTIDKFILQQKRDKQKEEWAEANNWTLIRISDKDAKKLETKFQLNDYISQHSSKSSEEDLEFMNKILGKSEG